MQYWPFSMFFLACTSMICLVGLVSPKFKDNIIQTCGMALLALGCASRVPDLWEKTTIPFDWFCVHAGIGLFSIGVFWKVYMRERAERFRHYASRFGMAWLDAHPTLARGEHSDHER